MRSTRAIQTQARKVLTKVAHENKVLPIIVTYPNGALRVELPGGYLDQTNQTGDNL